MCWAFASLPSSDGVGADDVGAEPKRVGGGMLGASLLEPVVGDKVIDIVPLGVRAGLLGTCKGYLGSSQSLLVVRLRLIT